MPGFKQTVQSKKRELRFTIFTVTTIVQFLLILAFTTVPVPRSDAQILRNQIPSGIDALGIFENNVMVGFPAFTPALGAGWLAYISITTGVVISAIGITNNPPAPGWLLWVAESQLPFFWLELMAYAVAVASGTMLFLTLLYDRRKIAHEFSRFIIGMVLFVLFLWDAAQIEYYTVVVSTGNPGTLLPLTDWIVNVSVGMLAVWAYTNVYGPRLRGMDWAILTGMLALLIVFPLAYVFLALFFLAYLFWKNPARTRPDSPQTYPATP